MNLASPSSSLVRALKLPFSAPISDFQAWTTSCGPLETNAFLLRSGSEMVVVDPAIDSFALRELARKLAAEGVQLVGIWNTHGHFDHVYDNAAWKRDFPNAPLLAHSEDAFFLEHLREQALWFGLVAPEVVVPDGELSSDQTLTVGEVSCRVVEVPGHSPGSVAFDFGDWIIGGDVLFAGSVGRTDLPGSSVETLAASLRRLFEKTGQTLIFPGHGPQTTIGEEKANNAVAREVLSRF